MMNASQISQFDQHADKNPVLECITPASVELNYETSQVTCPHREENPFSEKCQKLFKNIMALNVHLQMYHKESGIVTTASKYLSRPGQYHCPIVDCIFYCQCRQDPVHAVSFSNFNAVRLHYLRQHGLKKEQCSKCSKPFGLHQDCLAHEKICGIDCPFSCSTCHQPFHNRTSLRRHQQKYHQNETNNEFQAGQLPKNPRPAPTKSNESRKRPNRRRPLPPDRIELSRQNTSSTSHPSVTVNPRALELLKTFYQESPALASSSPESALLCQSESDKATQTYTRVSVGTECCSLTNWDFSSTRPLPTRTMEQKSSQTQSSIRVYNKRTRYSSKKTTSSTTTDEDPLGMAAYHMSSNASTMTPWNTAHGTDMETQMSIPSRSDMSIQTVGMVSNILHQPLESTENNHSVIIQTLPISMTSTQVQTSTEYPPEPANSQYSNDLLPYQESVGTSCFLDEFLLEDLSKGANQDSSVLFDFDAMDLLDLIDNGTQTYPLLSTHEAQTMTHWNPMLLNEDEWIRTMMNN